jgi:hypothetical protein
MAVERTIFAASRCHRMSDADYFRSHAIEALRKARRMAQGRVRNKQRIVARVYHQLAKAAAGSFSMRSVRN